MRSPAKITITCDSCGESQDVELIQEACDDDRNDSYIWDSFYVTEELLASGWDIEEAKELCPECTSR